MNLMLSVCFHIRSYDKGVKMCLIVSGNLIPQRVLSKVYVGLNIHTYFK